MAEWKDEKIYQCDHKIHLEKSETGRSHIRNIDQSHDILSHDIKKAIMEQLDLKLVSTMETKAPGSHPSKLLSIWPTQNHCFSQIAEGSISREQGRRGLGGCSASKAIALLPMILSGLGELKHP